MAKVNICMAVRDRPELTQQCLQSLYLSLRNSSLTIDWNLTIVDDGSSIRTRDFLIRRPLLGKNTSTHVLRNHDPLGVGGAKSLCAYASEVRWGRGDRGDLLYFTDNDMYFTEGWLELLVAVWDASQESQRIRVLGGYNNPFQAATGKWTPPLEVSPGREVRYYDALGGASMLMSWGTWDRHGPFDHNARGVRQSEDVSFGNSVCRVGGKLAAVCPHVVHDCGKTDTFGEKVPYADVMPDVEGAEVI